ncbi:hypothetical protein YTPLAS18_38950 [Nitrospira sp.]|nr:hypothetical protein YTPLAS18_38950 [Nitrospira sp.]
MTHGVTSREEFEFLADLVMRHSDGDHTALSVSDVHGGTTRFANNQIIQNVDTRRVTLRVTVAYGRRHGTASTTDLSAGAIQDAIRRAAGIARVSPEDPEYLPPLGPQVYANPPTWCPETSTAGPARRLHDAGTVIEECRKNGANAAGIVSSSESAAGIAASTGLRGYETRTEARFSVTAAHGDATGWVANAHRSIDRLSVAERTLTAIEKARQGGEGRELPPGRYTVVLEPAAVAGLVSWMQWLLDAKSYYKGTSPFAGKLGSAIIDRRLHLRNLPSHPDLLGHRYGMDGLPQRETSWIVEGVLTQLAFDRFTAQEHGVEPMPILDAPYLCGDAPVDDLIATAERAILVTNFWYLRLVNPTDLTLTGMTRDGTFLIEDGRVQGAVKNFRFHESPLRAFSRLDAYTKPLQAVTSETGKMLVPGLRLREFNFSSVTTF